MRSFISATMFSPVRKRIASQNTQSMQKEHLATHPRLKVIGKDAEAMTAAELLDNIARLREAGEPTAELEVDFHEKLAVSFAPIITVLLGVPFGLKGSRSGGLALGILYAVILLFGYYVVLAWGIALGHAGTLSPPVAGWAATMFFGLMGAYLFARVER